VINVSSLQCLDLDREPQYNSFEPITLLYIAQYSYIITCSKERAACGQLFVPIPTPSL